MFSNRLQWSLQPNDLSLLLDEKKRSAATVLDLTESNPTRAGFLYPPDILHALSNPAALLYEPAPSGLPSARDAIAALHDVPPSRVFVTASTSESYSYLFKLLCSPGDRILVPRPSYPLFEFLAKLESVHVDQYSLVYDSLWHIDFDSLKKAIHHRTKAVLLVNPNNPTGSFLKPAELDPLIDICARNDLALISDEVFSSYPLDPAPRLHSLAHVDAVLTVCLNGLSKLAGLPQMKAGWMLLNGPDQKLAPARDLLELIADTFLSVSSPVQHALPTLLKLGASVRSQIADRTRANLSFLRDRTSPLTVEGGWSAVLPIETEEYEFVLSLLRHRDVLTQPGFFFEFDSGNHIVLSLLTPEAVFREGVTRLSQYTRSRL